MSEFLPSTPFKNNLQPQVGFRRFALRRYKSFLRDSYQEELSMFALLLTYASQAYSLLSEFLPSTPLKNNLHPQVVFSEVCSEWILTRHPIQKQKLTTTGRVFGGLLFGGTKVSFGILPRRIVNVCSIANIRIASLQLALRRYESFLRYSYQE